MEAKKKTVQPSSKTVPWWQDSFMARVLRPTFDNIPPKQTLAEVRFIIKALDLKKGDSLLDICCGFGRHLLPLAKKGLKATGVDICEDYLQEAEREAQKSNVRVNLICEDCRKIEFSNTFAGAINVFTSFGFFEKEADNFKVLKNAYDALKPGGRFLLQTINRDWIARNYARRGWGEVGDYRILEERELDFASSRINATLTFIGKGEQVQKKRSLRIYCFHELREYFNKAGFQEITAYGGLDFSPVSFDSRELLIVGKKPRRQK